MPTLLIDQGDTIIDQVKDRFSVGAGVWKYVARMTQEPEIAVFTGSWLRLRDKTTGAITEATAGPDGVLYGVEWTHWYSDPSMDFVEGRGTINGYHVTLTRYPASYSVAITPGVIRHHAPDAATALNAALAQLERRSKGKAAVWTQSTLRTWYHYWSAVDGLRNMFHSEELLYCVNRTPKARGWTTLSVNVAQNVQTKNQAQLVNVDSELVALGWKFDQNRGGIRVHESGPYAVAFLVDKLSRLLYGRSGGLRYQIL